MTAECFLTGQRKERGEERGREEVGEEGGGGGGEETEEVRRQPVTWNKGRR